METEEQTTAPESTNTFSRLAALFKERYGKKQEPKPTPSPTPISEEDVIEGMRKNAEYFKKFGNRE